MPPLFLTGVHILSYTQIIEYVPIVVSAITALTHIAANFDPKGNRDQELAEALRGLAGSLNEIADQLD